MTDITSKTKTQTTEGAPQAPTIVKTCSFDWRDSRETRKTALFRVYAGYAILQHIRTVTVTQRTAPACEVDNEPSLNDIPESVRNELQSTGRDLVDGWRIDT